MRMKEANDVAAIDISKETSVTGRLPVSGSAEEIVDEKELAGGSRPSPSEVDNEEK